MKKIKEAYNKAKLAKVGDECICPSCGTKFVKTNYQQAFCKTKGKTKCKDKYWNIVIPTKRCNTTRISPASAAYMASQGLGKDEWARKRGYPDYNTYERDEGLEDGSWDAHGGVELAICDICGLRSDYCQCGIL